MYLNTAAKRLLLSSSTKKGATPMLRQAAMNYFMVNNKSSQAKLLLATASRAFSSLPPHVKLEMPNLSPTMEKVQKSILIKIWLGQHRQVAQEGRRFDQAG